MDSAACIHGGGRRSVSESRPAEGRSERSAREKSDRVFAMFAKGYLATFDGIALGAAPGRRLPLFLSRYPFYNTLNYEP